MASAQVSDSQMCCICGGIRCEEVYDHSHISNCQLENLLRASREEQPSVSELYAKVESYYKTLTEKLLEMISQDRRMVTQALKKLEFPFLEKEKVSMPLLCEVSSGDYSSLPTRKLIPILEALTRPR